MYTIIAVCVYLTFYSISISEQNASIENIILRKQVKRIAKEVDSLKKKFTSIHSEEFIHRDIKNITYRRGIPSEAKLYHDCNEIYGDGNIKSGIYKIWLVHGYRFLPVFCDMETVGAFSNRTGWIMIQRRMNGEVNFDRGWKDYVEGFGFPDREHWIGLENIHSLLRQNLISGFEEKSLTLRLDLEDWDGVKAFAEYDSFYIHSSTDEYRMDSLGRHVGTPELDYPLSYNLIRNFSTFDHNNDRYRSDDCIRTMRGGWWFGFCSESNLNGLYSNERENMTKHNMYLTNWNILNPNNTALRYVSMKLQ